MAETTTTAGAAGEQVTQEALLKSLEELEGKTATTKAPVATTVVVEPLAKSAATVIAEQGTETLKKALDVSAPLKEVVTLLGAHVDTIQAQMQKSLQASANRDLSILGVLEKLQKSIDANTAAVEAYGKTPANTPGSRASEVRSSEVLNKSTTGAGAGKDGEPSAAVVRKQVLQGLEILAKSQPPASKESMQYVRAISTLESTGKISDEMLLAANNAYKNQGKK
jgi:hypothetical protein